MAATLVPGVGVLAIAAVGSDTTAALHDGKLATHLAYRRGGS